MATMVNSSDTLTRSSPRNGRQRDKESSKSSHKGFFSRKKKKSDQLSSDDLAGCEDDLVANPLALDDSELDFESEWSEKGKKMLGNGTQSLPRGAWKHTNGSKKPYATTQITPSKLEARKDVDPFRPGERSPRHSKHSTSSSPLNPSPLAGTSATSGGSHLQASDLLSPTSTYSASRDSMTPTQDLVDTSSLIEYQRHLVEKSGIQAAWHLEEAMFTPMFKSVDSLEQSVNDRLGFEGDSTADEATAEDREDVEQALNSSAVDGQGQKKVITNYLEAKKRSLLTRPMTSDSDDDWQHECHHSPGRSSLQHEYSVSSPEHGMRPRSITVGAMGMPDSSSVPSSPSLGQRRPKGNCTGGGVLRISVHSLPEHTGSSRLSTGSLSSSTSSVYSIESSSSLRQDTPMCYSSQSITGNESPNTHKILCRTSSQFPRRKSADESHPLPAELPSRTQSMYGHRKMRVSTSVGGNIVQRDGHVRIKSARPLSKAEDESPSSMPPRTRISVPMEPFSPLLSPSPHATFFAQSTAPSCLYSPPVLSPGKGWDSVWTSSLEKRQIKFFLPTGSSVLMSCSGGKSVAQAKAMLWARLGEEGVLISQPRMRDMSMYSLKYCYKNNWYELFDELQMMQMLQVWQTWKKLGLDVGILHVARRREAKAKEMRLVMSISHLIGGGLTQYLQSSTPEIDWTRRSLVGVRLNAVRSRDRRAYSMEAEVTSTPIPSHIKEIFSSGSGMMTLEVYFMGELTSKKIDVFISMKPAEIMSDIFHHFKAEAAAYKADSTVEDFVLRVCQQQVFISGDHLFVNFSFVRECLSKHQPIKLSLVPVLDLDEDEPDVFEDEEYVDETNGLSAKHYQLTMLNKPHGEVFVMSMWDIGQNFRVRVIGLNRLTAGLLGRGERVGSVYIEAGIYHAGHSLIAHQRTSDLSYRSNLHWYQWVEFDLPTRHLPQAARICFSVMVTIVSQRGRQVRGPLPMYWVNMNVINHRSLLQQGNVALSMWPCSSSRDSSAPLSGVGIDCIDGEEPVPHTVMALDGTEASTCGMRPTGSSAVNSLSFDCPTLMVELDTYAFPVACPSSGWPCTLPQSPTEPSAGNMEQLDRVISNSAIVEISAEEKKLLFHHREYLSSNPKALVKFLMSVDWADLQKVQEAHRLIHKWAKISPEDALELLDFKFADKEVRSLAVSRLETLSNTDLVNYLLQLVQVLKFESYHDSALARFLVTRALKSKRIGHFFFWYLRAEMERPDYRQRYSLLLEAYLRGCGKAMMKQFQQQNKAVIGLNDVARRVKLADSRSEPTPSVSALLAEVELPSGFSPAFDCSIQLGELDMGACKVMSSKKKPLWLKFALDDVTKCSQTTKGVIFKQGDDLRQDMLTLQVLRLMDLLWQNDGLDLYMIPYGCMATGVNSGMIEVVADAQTIAKIQQEEGGGVLLPKGFAPFKKETVFNWLRKNNPRPEDLAKAVRRFTLSCAGYCVATYVMGIGDRHNDNIMLRRDGNLFHIDFGHFLGNIKYFNVFGKKVKRERLPFILTPDFIYVMSSNKENDLFPLFQRTCAQAFNVLRRHANVLINLFAMMKLTGIPELRGTEDLSYLHNVLRPDSTDAEAAEHFYNLIDECRENSDSVQANWALHIIGQQLAKS